VHDAMARKEGGLIMNNKILQYEELSMNAHPALQTQFFDGWVLRFANGYTNRANSINLLYQSSIGLKEKIAECEKRYFSQGLPAVYKLTDHTDLTIDETLDEMLYVKVTPTYVMDMDLNGKEYGFGNCEITNYADDMWLNAYFSFSRYTDCVKMTTAKQILENIKKSYAMRAYSERRHICCLRLRGD